MQREIGSEEFKEHFMQYGFVEDAAIVSDQAGVSRGFGFVTYDNAKSIEKALIVKHTFGGRIVDCKRAVPKEEIRNQQVCTHAGARGPFAALDFPWCLADRPRFCGTLVGRMLGGAVQCGGDGGRKSTRPQATCATDGTVCAAR